MHLKIVRSITFIDTSLDKTCCLSLTGLAWDQCLHFIVSDNILRCTMCPVLAQLCFGLCKCTFLFWSSWVCWGRCWRPHPSETNAAAVDAAVGGAWFSGQVQSSRTQDSELRSDMGPHRQMILTLLALAFVTYICEAGMRSLCCSLFLFIHSFIHW